MSQKKSKSKPELSPEVVDATKDDATTADVVESNQFSAVYMQYRTAYLYKVEQMEKLMGRGLVCEPQMGLRLQIAHAELLVRFISNVPPEEVKKAFGFILDTWDRSSFFTATTYLKHANVHGETRQKLPEWYKAVATIFLATAKHEVRFKVVGDTMSLDTIPDGIPAIFEQRMREFYLP